MSSIIAQVLEVFDRIPQFVFTWSIFFGSGVLLFVFLIARNGAKFSWKNLLHCCVPFNPLVSKSFHADVMIYIIRKVTDHIVLVPGAVTLAAMSGQVSNYLHYVTGKIPIAGGYFNGMIVNTNGSANGEIGLPAYEGYIIILLCSIVLFIVMEFSYYLWHYMEHKIPFLWELHKVHHSADVLNPLTNLRAHPSQVTAKYILSGVLTGVPAGVFMFYFGFSFVEILLLAAFSNKIMTVLTLDPLRHSHIPLGFGLLDRLLVSPHMHQVHHSSEKVHWDKNFGTNLSIFDWLFGTAYRPERGEKITSGIYGYSDDDLQEFNTLKGAYITPLKRSFQSMARVFAPKYPGLR